jgi:hypothetical protein
MDTTISCIFEQERYRILVSDNTFILCVQFGSPDALALPRPYQGTHDCVFIRGIASKRMFGLSYREASSGLMPRKVTV